MATSTHTNEQYEEADGTVPIETQRAWLTEETYDRARIELELLRVQRGTGSFIEYGDEEQCARRIRQLQEILSGAVVGFEPPDDGIAEPGMVLTVRYEADGHTATFLMAGREEATEDGLSICSPHSPLGTAIGGAAVGDRRDVRLPGGDIVTVTLVDAIPYRHPDHPRTA